MKYNNIKVPEGGAKISIENGKITVPDNPIIPFVEGDGTGRDIWRASIRVFDAAVEKAYGGKRKVNWLEVYAGEKAFKLFNSWLPKETIEACKEFRISIKGPLTTPVGGGIRSLNVAMRQLLDLYVCMRPVRYYRGSPSEMKRPQDVDIIVFRENTEDIYTGAEFELGTKENAEFMAMFKEKFPEQFAKIPYPDTTAISIKPVSPDGTARLVRAAINWALENNRKRVTLIHQGDVMRVTEEAFMEWGYDIAKKEFRNQIITEAEKIIISAKEANPKIENESIAREIDPSFDKLPNENQKTILQEIENALELWDTHGDGKWKKKLLINDSLANEAFHDVLVQPLDFDVIATMNLNGDYISDAIAAQVGGMGIAPGANINYESGHAVFEATHGTAPKYADLDKVNPSSVILSGEMMFRHMGWTEAADLIVKGMEGAISAKTVTYDFERLMENATTLKCSEFGDAIIKHMDD